MNTFPRTMNGANGAFKDATYACALEGPRPRRSLLSLLLKLFRRDAK